MRKKEKKFLGRLLSDPLFQFLSSNEALVEAALEGPCSDGDVSEILADDYFHLLKALHKGKKPASVTLDRNAPYLVIADGITYDLDAIRHNDTVNTERKMEIEALLGDGVSIETVQTQLNQKIKEDW